MQDLINMYNKTKYLYEQYYDVHICKEKEIEEVLLFIHQYWQKDHILTRSRELLDWQHRDKKNKRYNFVVAKSRKTNEIHGIIGFILSSIYDEDIKTPIRWGAIWKVREDVAVKGLGLYLKGYLEEMVPVQYIGGVGLSKDSKAIDTKLGETMGKLRQYYIANPYLDEFALIKEPKFPSASNMVSDDTKEFVFLKEAEFCDKSSSIKNYLMPYKSVTYYIQRYFRHPIYQYEFVEIREKENTIAIFVFRKVYAEGKTALFIVDYIGPVDAMAGCYQLFTNLLQNQKAEHISFPCSGMKEEALFKAGFLLLEPKEMILPVYYEPFVRQNVELDYHFWSSKDSKNIIIVKGDADQDRPNRLPEERND